MYIQINVLFDSIDGISGANISHYILHINRDRQWAYKLLYTFASIGECAK